MTQAKPGKPSSSLKRQKPERHLQRTDLQSQNWGLDIFTKLQSSGWVFEDKQITLYDHFQFVKEALSRKHQATNLYYDINIYLILLAAIIEWS